MVHCDWEGLAVSHGSHRVSAGTALSAGVTRILLLQELFCQELSAKFAENISCSDGAYCIFISPNIINQALA